MEEHPKLDLARALFTHTSSDCNAVSGVSDTKKDNSHLTKGNWRHEKFHQLVAVLLESEGMSMSKPKSKISWSYQDLTEILNLVTVVSQDQKVAM